MYEGEFRHNTVEGKGTFTSEGVAALCDGLRHVPSVTSLNLRRNQLCGETPSGKGAPTTAAVAALRDGLPRLPWLRALKLGHNHGVVGHEAMLREAIGERGGFELELEYVPAPGWEAERF